MKKGSSEDIIYHYTDQDGLLGIIKSGMLWATNLYYLNDSSELLYGLNVVRAELSKLRVEFQKALKERADIGEEIADIPNRILSRLEQMMLDDIYVFSFSKVGNDLPLWRTYCSDSSGFSIGFNRSELQRSVELQRFKLEECIYGEEEQGEKVGRVIEKLVRAIFDDFGKNPSTDPYAILTITDRITREFYPEFRALAPIIKHPAFEKEQECRLFSSMDSPVYGEESKKKKDFRKGQSMVIPYFKFCLFAPLPIKEIIVGPTPHPSHAKESVRQLIERANLQDCLVTYCDLPFLKW